MPFPRTGQGGDPIYAARRDYGQARRSGLRSAGLPLPGPGCYPYWEPPPAPPPGGPPPGPPAEAPPGLRSPQGPTPAAGSGGEEKSPEAGEGGPPAATEGVGQ